MKRNLPHWNRLLERVRRDDFFLGHALSVYQEANNLNDTDLAGWLECSEDLLRRLALCRKPEDQSPRFQEDVRRIADFAQCNPDRLVRLLRESAAIGSLTEGAHSDGLLMAALDRGEKKKRKPGKKTTPSDGESQ
ncbi:MAG: hypothetical protein ACE5JX_18940 [Acidobacteriota bacterium]